MHRDFAVKEVILGQREDIDRYVACGVDERPQVANELRAKHLALQIDKEQHLQLARACRPQALFKTSGADDASANSCYYNVGKLHDRSGVSYEYLHDMFGV